MDDVRKMDTEKLLTKFAYACGALAENAGIYDADKREAYKSIRAELLRRLDAPWLPIETAPKDGTNPARPASEEKPE